MPVRLPGPTESAAIALSLPKTAALFYDRLWGVPGQGSASPWTVLGADIPDEIRFSGGDPLDPLYGLALGLQRDALSGDSFAQEMLDAKILQVFCDSRGISMSDLTQPQAKAVCEVLRYTYIRMVVDSLWQSRKISAVPVFGAFQQFERAYKPGDFSAVIGAIGNLRIIDEDSLEWDKVLEFRRDSSSRRKLQRMKHWLDKDMIGKSQQFIEEDIAERIEDYDTVLREWNIRTVLGCISAVVDAKELLAGIAGVFLATAVNPLAGILATGGFTVANVAVKLASTKLDIIEATRGAGRDIAFVLEARRLSG